MNKKILFIAICLMAGFLCAQTRQTLLSVGHQYIALLQKLSRDESIERESALLFSPYLKKVTNSHLICQGLKDYQEQIKNFHATERLRTVTLLELIESKDTKACIIRFEITYHDGTIDTVISLLKYDDSGKIEEINQVYGAKGSYTWESKEK